MSTGPRRAGSAGRVKWFEFQGEPVASLPDGTFSGGVVLLEAAAALGHASSPAEQCVLDLARRVHRHPEEFEDANQAFEEFHGRWAHDEPEGIRNVCDAIAAAFPEGRDRSACGDPGRGQTSPR